MVKHYAWWGSSAFQQISNMSEANIPLPADPISAVGVVGSVSKAPEDYYVVSAHFKHWRVNVKILAELGLEAIFYLLLKSQAQLEVQSVLPDVGCTCNCCKLIVWNNAQPGCWQLSKVFLFELLDDYSLSLLWWLGGFPSWHCYRLPPVSQTHQRQKFNDVWLMPTSRSTYTQVRQQVHH